jgi:O-antigen/teichoic acid export membrane protein
MNSAKTHASAIPRPAAAWLNVAAKVGGAGISFLLYIVLARVMTPEAFADVAVVFAWLALASAVACCSAPLVLIRYLPETLIQGRPDLARGALQFMIGVTAALAIGIGGIGAAAVLFGLVNLPRDLAHSALAAAAVLLPGVLLLDLAGLLTSLKRAVIGELLVNLLRPALVVVGVLLLWLVYHPPISAPVALAVYLAASVVTVLVCVAYTLRVLPRELVHATPTYAVRDWTRSAAGFMAVTIVVQIHERVDILLMGLIASSADIAAYAVAIRFALTVALAASAVGTVMMPHFVERLVDLRQGRRDEVQALVRSSARTAFYVCLIALAGFAIFGPLILKLFGPHYGRAYAPLVILATGQAICALVGPALGVATLAGEPRIAIVSLVTGIIVNAGLNVWLVPLHGANGAAIATASGTIFASVIAWAWTRSRLLLDTSVFRLTP